MNIKVLRLISGEEIIGDVEWTVKEGEVIYTIKKPAIIGVFPGENGQPQVGLAEWLHFADAKQTEFKISGSKIIISYTPELRLINAYNKQFGSGIVIPQGGLITG